MAATVTCHTDGCPMTGVVIDLKVALRTPDEPVFCGSCAQQTTMVGTPDLVPPGPPVGFTVPKAWES